MRGSPHRIPEQIVGVHPFDSDMAQHGRRLRNRRRNDISTVSFAPLSKPIKRVTLRTGRKVSRIDSTRGIVVWSNLGREGGGNVNRLQCVVHRVKKRNGRVDRKEVDTDHACPLKRFL